jgi:two-component system, sensor histidine kinase and response regulator
MQEAYKDLVNMTPKKSGILSEKNPEKNPELNSERKIDQISYNKPINLLSHKTNIDEINVLLVDDDQVDRLAVKRAFKQADMQISFTEAKDYTEAIAILENQILKKQSFDCIFVDYNLPGQDGLAVVEAIHQLNIFSPIIILTGQGDEQIAVKLMKSGVTDYLPKSQVSPKTLAKILQDAIRVHQAIVRATLADQRLHESHALLVRKNKELRLLEKQGQDFIAHLTHDLKTPIVAADLMLKLFQKEAFCPLSEEMHNAIAAMVRSNHNLLDIVNTLLEVHCYESGEKELTLIDFDLWQIAEEIIAELQPLANEKGILLSLKAIAQNLDLDSHLSSQQNLHSLQPSPKVQFQVRGDCLEIRRMLTNLVGNSIKFTDMGFVELCLGLSHFDSTKEEDLDWVTIQVRDSGIGMSMAEQESLFKRFRKGSHKQSGSGLGLHLVERIVSVHHGTISVTSELGKGSLFMIRLPVNSYNQSDFD